MFGCCSQAPDSSWIYLTMKSTKDTKYGIKRLFFVRFVLFVSFVVIENLRASLIKLFT